MKKLLTLAAITLAIAGFALAEITYPVDVVNTRWAVLDTNSGEIIARQRTWPVADGSEIPGLATNIVYLLHASDAVPQYDGRVFVLHSTETIQPSANRITKSYAAVRRPNDDISVAAKNREMEEVERHTIDLAREVLETRLLLTALIQYAIDGQDLPPKVKDFADDYKAKGVKLWKNRDRLKALLLAIEGNEDFDLDAGWEEPE